MPGLTPDDLDAVVVATSTPDLTFPSVATMVQAGLGMPGGFAFDVQAVCAGFVYALANANALILSGQADRVAVIGAETFSRIMDWTDRSTCVLFGDGAGALILEAQEGATARPPTAASSPPTSIPTAATAICSMSMAASPPAARPAS
jgi:3-oxoacyl-[acyl-carrier-protein] synthase-3